MNLRILLFFVNIAGVCNAITDNESLELLTIVT